jgi:hypothetical protein
MICFLSSLRFFHLDLFWTADPYLLYHKSRKNGNQWLVDVNWKNNQRLVGLNRGGNQAQVDSLSTDPIFFRRYQFKIDTASQHAVIAFDIPAGGRHQCLFYAPGG